MICEATHPLHSGNFKQVSLKLLHKVHSQQRTLGGGTTTSSTSSSSSSASPPRPSSYSKQTLLFNGHTFNFCFHDNIYCLAMCDASMRHSTPFLFLTDVLSTFLRVSNEGQSAIEGPSLKALTEVLQNRMESYSDEAYLAQHEVMEKAAAAATGQGTGSSSATAANTSHHSTPSNADSATPSTLPLTHSSSTSHAASSSPSASHSSASSSSSSSAHHPRARGGGGSSTSSAVDYGDEGLGLGGDGEEGRGHGLVSDVRRELDGVKEKLMDNLDRVMSRGEALESLVDRSSALHDSSDAFKQASARLKSQLRWQQMRSAVTLVTMTAICVYILAASKCGVALNAC